MDSDGGGFRAPERYPAGLCALALAHGDLADGTGGDIHPGEQHCADADDAEVLDNYPPARDWGGGDPKAYCGANFRRCYSVLSTAEGVCV